ncbi:MAG TPA: acetylglutamate kinase [Gaiellaceae bacterium]|nr:acetylglutamate kinase [Gaiellaceae bacterium]
MSRGITVVKVGGAVVGDELGALRDAVVVHGGGPQISAAMAAAGLEVTFVHGRRVTSPAAIEVVRDALLAVNRQLCALIGPRAVGLAGDEIGLEAIPVPELGLVGSPVPSRPQAIVDALAAGLIPVVAPVAAGPLNVNADEAAAALAIGLGAGRILFLTDVPGVLDDDRVLDRIGADEVEAGSFEGGIVPKLHAAVVAARTGVRAEIGRTLVTA